MALAHHASEAVGGEVRPEEESSASPLCGLKTPPPPSQRGHLFLVGAEAGALSGHLDVGMAAPEAGGEGVWEVLEGEVRVKNPKKEVGVSAAACAAVLVASLPHLPPPATALPASSLSSTPCFLLLSDSSHPPKVVEPEGLVAHILIHILQGRVWEPQCRGSDQTKRSACSTGGACSPVHSSRSVSSSHPLSTNHCATNHTNWLNSLPCGWCGQRRAHGRSAALPSAFPASPASPKSSNLCAGEDKQDK